MQNLRKYDLTDRECEESMTRADREKSEVRRAGTLKAAKGRDGWDEELRSG